MRRGSIIIAADRRGEFTGKPRPALVVSNEALDAATIAVLPITSRDSEGAPLLRIRLPPNQDTGLAVTSWARIEQVTTIRPQRIGRVIGEADDTTMMAVNRALAVFLAIG